MADLAGYLDRWSALPGTVLAVHLSCAVAAEARVDLVRLGRGTERDDPDGICHERVAELPERTVAVQPRATDAGSYAEFTGLDAVTWREGSLALWVQPWGVAVPEQTIALLLGANAGAAVVIDDDGFFALRLGPHLQRTRCRAHQRRWTMLQLAWSAMAVRLTVTDADGRHRGTVQVAGNGWPDRIGRMLLAGAPLADGSVGAHFDGRIERPVLWPEAIAAEQAVAALLHGHGLPDGAIACWDFARGIDGFTLTDLGPHGWHGSAHQGPKRAVRGARWNGEAFDWRQAPAQYAAIHFHRDDLLDAGWPVSLRVTLPPTLPSGAYALRVRCAADDPAGVTDGQLRLPVFVRAALQGEDRVPPDTVALVFPTFTYLAYGNDRCALLGRNPEVLADRAIELEATDVLLSRHPQWGLSLYDTHHDGSGVSLTSRWRPIPNIQPDQRNWQACEGSGRWNYAGDLLLVEWLEREGIAWHALTDEDVHGEGLAALAPYRVVLTGNHPEYASARMVDAYRRFVDGGGRLMYLGGNGFYWRVACHDALPGVVELRRAEDGNRSWAEEPGEYYHALDGGYGGLWRRNGLAPQSWLGVGYAGQGFRRSAGYRRAQAADPPAAAFVFDGVRERDFGLRGAIGGACAGVEVDRFDETLGSDPGTLLLASSLPFDSTYLVANEELLVSRPTISAEFSPTLRADMALRRVHGGGAVFSTGSIAWVGGLHERVGDPAVQRITLNVLRRFVQPAPLAQDDDAD